jgi:hypothetical protein
LLCARYGIEGNAPLTIAQLCAQHSTTPTGMERRVRTALRAASTAFVKATQAPPSLGDTDSHTAPGTAPARE